MPVPVLQIITRLIVGGAQETVMYAADLIDTTRFQVSVLSGPQTGSEGSLIPEVQARGIPLTLLPDLVRQVSPLHDLRAVWEITRFIRQGGFQVVHTNSSKAGILGRVAAWLARTPVIVHTVHGWSFHDYMPPVVRQTYILLERFTARFTDALVVVTRLDIDKGLQHRIGRRSQYHLIRSAIPIADFTPRCADQLAARQALGLPLEAPVLGNVGRFSDQKNPLAWVRIAGEVGRLLPNCRFLLVGDGPLRPQVEAALHAEGIFDRTLLVGLRRDVPRLFAAMDVFLLTSLWEGLPRTIPQAMLMGLPVVAYGVDGSAEAILDGETGYVCSPSEDGAMAARCLELLSSPNLRHQMGQRGRQFALEEFDVLKMVSQLEDLYLTLLEAKQ